ncbi:MAG TPA: glycosyltransferase [Bacteroidales bacterium]|nr:glycosyltransferase [Bacteroidales bacterium]
MKILQINNCHYSRGGADIVYLNTGKLLEDHGHQVFYFSQKNQKNIYAATSNYFVNETNYFRNSFFEKLFSIPRFFYSLEARKKISKLIIDLHPDVAHFHLYKAVLTPSILMELKKHKIPTIITLHDYGFLCPHNSMLNGKLNICSRCVKGSALNCIVHKCNRNNIFLSSISAFEYLFQRTFFPFEKYFDHIISVSKFGQKLHQNSGYFKRSVDHLYNYYPKIETTEPNCTKGNYFLFLGRLSVEKGIKTLFSAWLNTDRNSMLKVVGTGEMFDELNQMSKDNHNIQLLGFKSGNDLDVLIREASFIIVPSEWNENNPLTIIEAYANGKPVIGSNAGGIPEIIQNGKTGFLFEMKSVKELSDIIDFAEKTNEQEYSRLSANARQFAVDNFAEDKHYNSLMSIYNNLLK